MDNTVHRGMIPGFPLFYLVPARLLAGFDDLLIFDSTRLLVNPWTLAKEKTGKENRGCYHPVDGSGTASCLPKMLL
jgi:hypothetical protein